MAYPRSFLGLCLASFMLVAAPLVAALAYSAWHSERLAEQSRSAVFNASQAARASRTLVNRIGSLERLALLDAPGLDPDLGRVHASFRQVAEELLQLPLEDDQLAALKKTMAQEQGLYDLLDRAAPSAPSAARSRRWPPSSPTTPPRCSRSAPGSPTARCCGCAPTPRRCSASSCCW